VHAALLTLVALTRVGFVTRHLSLVSAGVTHAVWLRAFRECVAGTVAAAETVRGELLEIDGKDVAEDVPSLPHAFEHLLEQLNDDLRAAE